VQRYRTLYTSLRALEVTDWSYHTSGQPVTTGGQPGLTALAEVAYCFSNTYCAQWTRDAERGSLPVLRQTLKMDRRGGRYVIVDEKTPQGNGESPPPWAVNEMTFVKGKRVTVGATAGNAGRLPAALAAADRAAEVSDRYAGMLNNKVNHYRVYLADDQQWATWFHGRDPKTGHAVGYATKLGDTLLDVVLKLDELKTDEQLHAVLKHEFGHVVTLANTPVRYLDLDKWLTEGIAEYIEAAPRTARETGSAAEVRNARQLPTTLSAYVEPPSPSRDDRGEFYAIAHTAVSCLAERHGEQKLMDFTRAMFIEKLGTDGASRKAFGKPWREVDQDCIAYIRQVAGR
jgi:hypothetical protein